MRRRLFISYRRKENAWAIAHLRERLCVEYGAANVFLDTHEIQAGEDWRSRLERELLRADVVVLVHGESWLGQRDDGSLRVQDAEDPVRFELVTARAAGKLIVPLAIDATEVPSAEVLPPDLQFVKDLHFERLQATVSLEDQINRLIVQIRDQLRVQSPVARLLGQALWVSLVALGMVGCLNGGGVLRVFQDAYAAILQPHMSARMPFEPDDVAFMSVDDVEYGELFAGRSPLNPEVMTIAVDRLLEASRASGVCGRSDHPVGFYVDLAPGAGLRASSKTEALSASLEALAACRPVVLICPSSLKGGAPSADDRAWVRRLRGAPEAPPRLWFTSPDLDPKVLRTTRGRYEFGLVMGDLAAGLVPFQGRSLDRCACTTSEDEALACRESPQHQALSEWDAAEAMVATRIRGYTFSQGLDGADEVARRRLLVVGTHYGRHGRYAVASYDPQGMVGATPGVHVQAALAYQASQGASFRQPAVVLAGEWLASLLTSVGLMAMWVQLARHLRFKRRVAVYAGVLALTLGHLAVWAAAAAWEPRLIHVATFATLAITFTALRSLLTGYEVLLNDGVEWRSVRSLWLAIRERRDRSSAIARLTVVLIEAAIVTVGAVMLVTSL